MQPAYVIMIGFEGEKIRRLSVELLYIEPKFLTQRTQRGDKDHEETFGCFMSSS